MGSCCSGGESEADNKFTKGGENDLSEGPVQNRRCTDCLCIPLFVVAQVVFVIVTIAGMGEGDPSKLYKPRDYQGAYCGVASNWNDGPVTTDMPSLSYTMNVTSTVDVIVQQLVCSSEARDLLTVDDGQQGPLLTSEADRSQYLRDCCWTPNSECDGSLGLVDLSTPASITSVITARMSELTDLNKAAELFSPSGANGPLFGQNFWSQATAYFNTVCLPSCDTNSESLLTLDGVRTFTYEPTRDMKFHGVWTTLKGAQSANPGVQAIQDVISTQFTFQALPLATCPYDPELCVPFPGVEFTTLTGGYCGLSMSAEAVSAVGSAVANVFEGMAGSSFATGVADTFGNAIGDFQQAVDTFVIVAFGSFVVGLVFLVLLRFFVGVCVWLALLASIFMFFVGGAFLFVLSGQCQGASIWETGQQSAVAVWIVGTTAANNALNGDSDVPSEALSGDGADYRGAQTQTKNGLTCLDWDTQDVLPEYTSTDFPDAGLEANYCRNPYPEGSQYAARTIWCITADPIYQWEECAPIGVIQPECSQGYVVENETGRQALFISSFVMWILGLVLAIVICCASNRIRLAIALNKVAAHFVGANAGILVVPMAQAVMAIAWTASWIYAASFLLSQVPENYTPMGYFATYEEAYGTTSPCPFWEFGDHCKATPGACNDRWPTGFVWKDADCEMDGDVPKCWRCAPPRYVIDWRFATSFFVFLWNNAFNVALGQILIAMAVGFWFFTVEKGKTSVIRKSTKTVFRYHLGTVAFGSFIVALVQFIRYCMEYLQKQAEAQKNRVAVCILGCLKCCIWAFEKCIKFLNKNAYIQTALLGTPFCASARKAFFLILRNLVRFGTLAALSGIIHSIGFLAIMSGTMVGGYFLLREMHSEISPVMPMLSFAVVSWVVAKLYMNVFGLAVDTSLQCFLAIEEMGVGDDFVPSELKDFVDTKTRGGLERAEQRAEAAKAAAASKSDGENVERDIAL